MNRFARLTLAALGLLVFVGVARGAACAGAQADPAHATAKPRTLALWVWDAGAITQEDERTRLFGLCLQKDIRLLFVDVGDCFSYEQGSGSKPRVTSDQLAEFVRGAHRQGIKVHALDGDPHWAMARQHAAPMVRLTRALEYNQTVPVPGRLDGFQFDIEPYLLPDFRTAKRESILSEYLDLLSALCRLVNEKQPALELGVAHPFWLDGASELSSVAWKGRAQPFTFHVIDELDTIAHGYIAVMAYRDVAAGADGSIRHATDEIVYAHEHAKRVEIFVGQETAEAKGDPEKITFFEEGAAALDEAIMELAAALNHYPRFAGIAIHHYDSYKRWFPASPGSPSSGCHQRADSVGQ